MTTAPLSQDPRRTGVLAIPRRVIVIGLVAMVVMVLGGFYLSGPVAGKPGEFDWVVAAGTGTTLGTLALALMTVGLGIATEQSVALARDEQRSRELPTVIVASVNIDLDRVRVSLFNMGLGPAIGVRVWLRQGESGEHVRSRPEMAVLAFIATGPQGQGAWSSMSL